MIRIDKLLSLLGFETRSNIKKLIKNGNLIIDNKVVYESDIKVDPQKQKIIFLDQEIKYKEYVYYLLNKPKDYVCANNDFRYRTVLDLIPDKRTDLAICGRLDIDTTGLLIITNDGKLIHKLISPKFNIEKEYFVKYDKPLPKDINTILKNGIKIDDYITKPSYIKNIDSINKTCNIVITEGKYHQVKKMFNYFNIEVLELKRVRFNKLNLPNNLDIGEYKELDFDELKLLTDYL